jgi:hypothetical protein
MSREPEQRFEWRFEHQEDEPLVEFLERDQLVADRSVPVPPARLSRRAQIALWVLRVFVFVLSGMVIYVFVDALGH